MKKKELIPAISPVLHALREEGMRLSPSLVEQILRESGE
jgi:predicted nucleic acid-binding protein